MAEASFFEEHKKYDYLQFVIPDVNTIPRGKIVRGKFKEVIARNGFEIVCDVCLSGPSFETPSSVLEVIGSHLPSELMRPCLDTMTPWPWVGSKVKQEGPGRRVGNVLCDLIMRDGTPDLTSPRQLMKAQLDALWEQHKLVLKSAFEYEFDVFKETAGSMERLGGDDSWWGDVRHWGVHHDLFCDLTDLLELMGVEVSALIPEFSPGQWEMTTDPEEGVRGGDVAFYVKNAVKGFFRTRGYQATFMSKTSEESDGNALQLNHSLWTKTGDTGETNVMLDKQDPDLLSPTARHWLAGILTHGPALAALCCPTLNCYRRLHQHFTPGKVFWGLDDREAMVRVRTAQDNVFFENRLPSGSCCPYLAISATVAAGLDGLNRQLPCPKPRDVQGGELPRTLEEALTALEKDERLCSLLGDRFVQCFINGKREHELQQIDTSVLNTEEKRIDFERKMYMKNL